MTPRDLAISPMLLCLLAGTAHGIQLGILDDFEDATTSNWAEANQSPNPPVAVFACGVSGTYCLQATAAGGGGPGSRQAIYNRDQWAGDYIAAGVNQVQMQLSNASVSETIYVRIGVTNSSTCYVSTNAVEIPAGTAGLQLGSFLLDDSTMTEVTGNSCFSGGDSLDDVLSNVSELRIISAQTIDWRGDAVATVINIDEIQSKADSDLDGVNDDFDNCSAVQNPDQLDADNDGFGNLCDGDLNNDCMTDFQDLVIMKTEFFSVGELVSDLTGNGTVDFEDLAAIKQVFFGTPGPGLGDCDALP